MQRFHTSGPVVPKKRYAIAPLERLYLDSVLQLVREEQHFVLHPLRQAGEISALLALQDLLTSGMQGGPDSQRVLRQERALVDEVPNLTSVKRDGRLAGSRGTPRIEIRPPQLDSRSQPMSARIDGFVAYCVLAVRRRIGSYGSDGPIAGSTNRIKSRIAITVHCCAFR